MADPRARPDAVARFTAVYDECYASVYRYAVSRAGRQLAEEVASETFLVAWRRLDELPDPPTAWLLGVASNLVRTQYRQAARWEARRVELRGWVAEPTTADIADDVVERSMVLQALARLSGEDRELLTLVAWHGLSTTQAASVVGCSPAAYFVRLHRARRRLRQAMDGVDRGTGPAAATAPAGFDKPSTPVLKTVKESIR
ncbi:MAG TPA: sigma-70 family RNA polymerase sigma factor [Catenuloplanes sp.]